MRISRPAIISSLTALLLLLPMKAEAQYYEIANQAVNMLRPALSGSLNYKGFISAGYLKGIGQYNADVLNFSTSQGFTYSSWFYMGVGAGVDVLFSHTDNDFGNWTNPDPEYTLHGSTATGCMIPLFTDFRFNIGKPQSAAFYIDVKVGCSFLVGKDYLRVNDGFITSQQYFYLRPSLGVRIPTNSKNTKQAFDIGVDYQLLTSNYWNSWNRNVTLNALGVNIAYEW